MRHKIAGRKLGRTTAERKSLYKNLANALFTHEQIITTLPKAKELRSYAERLITVSKTSNLANKRRAFATLRDEHTVKKLFTILNDRYKDRNGGYTRVLKYGFRKGDNAPMALIELVDRDESAKGYSATANAKEATNS
jgi:large subunit ribosomal protein L17